MALQIHRKTHKTLVSPYSTRKTIFTTSSKCRRWVRRLQNDPALAQQFLAKASFERITRGPIEALLSDPGSAIARQFEANLGQIGGPASLRRTAEASISSLALDPLERTARARRALRAAGERFQIADMRGGLTGAIRGQIGQVLRASGQSALGQRFSNLEFDFGTFGGGDPITGATTLLGRRAEQLTRTTQVVGANRAGEIRIARPVSEQDHETADLLREIITELQGLRQVTQQNGGGRSLIPAGQNFRFGPQPMVD